MYVCVDVCAMRDGRVLCPMPKSVPRLRPAMSRQSVSGVCICAYAYICICICTRPCAGVARACVRPSPVMPTMLCSLVSCTMLIWHVSTCACACRPIGADMHMCMGACPAGVVVRSPTASYPISLSDSRGFGSCRVPSSHHLHDGPDHAPITRSYVCHRGFLHPHGCSPATRPL